MGLNIVTFQAILDTEFFDRWYSTPLSRSDTALVANPRYVNRSPDTSGTFGLLHWLDGDERRSILAHSRASLSHRQTAEWVIRQLQGSFGRLPLPLHDTND